MLRRQLKTIAWVSASVILFTSPRIPSIRFQTRVNNSSFMFDSLPEDRREISTVRSSTKTIIRVCRNKNFKASVFAIIPNTAMLVLQYFFTWQQVQVLVQGYSISGPRAKCGPRRPNNWPAEHCQNVEQIKLFSKFIKLFFYFVSKFEKRGLKQH